MKKVFILVSLIVLMFSGFCFATDDWLYPGVMGQRASGPTPVEVWGAWCNPSSTQTLSLACPVPRDQTGKTIASSWVKFQDQNYSKDACARLISSYRSTSTGAIYYWASANKCTSGSGAIPQTLYPGGVTANNYTTSYFWVTLPPTYSGNKSCLLNYWINENN